MRAGADTGGMLTAGLVSVTFRKLSVGEILAGVKKAELGSIEWGGDVHVPQGDSIIPMVATPADFHGTPTAHRCAAPALGEHTAEILAELDG